MISRCLSLFIVFLLLPIHTAWAGNSSKLFEVKSDTKSPLPDPVRGFRQVPLLDMVLIYQGGIQRMDWTPGEIRPYVVHTNQSNEKDWFFDGFLFLEFQDGAGYNYNPGYSGNKEARKLEWEWLAHRLFEDGKALRALNSCIEEAKKELGEPSFRHKVVIGLPEPFLNQKDWGELEGTALDFSKRGDRVAACQWYIDLLRDKFEEANLAHIDLEGFYWVSEQMSTNDFITVEIGDYIRSKGQRFYWIPYYMSNGYSQWKDYGFDIAYLQPNYFFNKKIGEARVRDACDLAFTHNMGMEMEFDARALHDSKENHGDRLMNYINTFKEQNVFKDSSIAYYEGGRGIYQFSRSSNPKDKEMMDLLHSLIAERRIRMHESIAHQQDFKREQFINNEVWTTVGEKHNVKFTGNGLEISSGGNITKLHTRGKMDIKHGRVELTAKIISNNNDARVRFHLLPTEERLGGWPASGELFLLSFDGTDPGKARVGANTDEMNEKNGKIRESVLNWGTGYYQTHTFVCEWDEKKITFYIDGMKVNIQEDLFEKQYSNYANFWPFNEKFYFQISVESNSMEPIILVESIKISK